MSEIITNSKLSKSNDARWSLSRIVDERISVIAVQDLDAHSYYTWVRKQDLVKKTKSRHRRLFDLLRDRRKEAQTDEFSKSARTTSEIAETMWLRDLLSSFVLHAQIVTYSYESNWRRANVKTSLRKCDEQLLNILHQNRSQERVNTIVLNIHIILLKASTKVSTIVSIYRS
jgi:hypothetical protein